ncbi:MAG: hypothetical protein M1815_003801 [Lichina confinis]|nr:MAG: hypothetical protein M1815_003801 [Lichina confinis]
MALHGRSRSAMVGLLVHLAVILPMVVAADFKKCNEQFKNNQTNMDLFGFTGSTHGRTIKPGTPLMSVRGCEILCGSDSQYKSWKESTTTISTWVLPMIGLILQAPFESNAKMRTFFATIRWLGSPVAALFHMLWNIKITAKCATMVDMSVPYDSFPGEESDFAQMRDSLGILSVMNQYTVDPKLDSSAAEKLVRVALFSNEVRMTDGGPTLAQRRRDLAANVREGRRRGIIPVFVTLMWFIFSLVISLADAFEDDNLGNNTLAHDLAIGLLMAWIPVLILAGIVDRNPSAPGDTRRRLNALVNDTRRALRDPQNQETIVSQGGGWRDRHYPWLDQIVDDAADAARFGAFFHDFAGQGRLRMHFGIAHPIMSNIEFSYVGQHGRDWLRHERDARWALVYGHVNPKGLFYFDWRELWQILGAVLVVGGAIAGSFVISFLTPTVGLGCRSGGYMIYMVLAGALLLAELVVWWATWRGSRIRATALKVFPVAEFVSTAWLLYIVSAQTIGSHKTCACMGSTWAGQGGYINLDTSEVNTSESVRGYWGVGTALSCAVMGAAFAFVVAEWCEQSFLHTQSYSSAMRGMRRTRRWKRLTLSFRHVPDRVIELVKWMLGRRERHSMIWSVHARYHRQKAFDTELTRTSSRLPGYLGNDDDDHGSVKTFTLVSPASTWAKPKT